MDDTALAMAGRQLNADQVAALEQKVEQKPDDVTSRTKLLGYYFLNQHSDDSFRAAKQRHVLWLVQHMPHAGVLGLPFGRLDPHLDPEAYGDAKQVWLEHLEDKPEDMKVLEHSARFFLLHDQELAEKYLLKGKSLAPEDPKWPSALGQLYSLEMHTTSRQDKRRSAGKALMQMEIAYQLSTEVGRDSMLGSIAKVAFEADKLEVAKEYATKMLNQQTADWNTGNNVFNGNVILGRLALHENDVPEAKRRLLAAGRTTGSPQLGSFGPNMTLAKELLELGETEVVLEYFALCEKFWGMGKDRLEQWSSEVEAGKVPAFGGNLNY